MRILIIEDERRLANYLKKGLTESGYVVDVATDGVDGSHLAIEGAYDLVLMDVMLPGLDGFEVLKQLREQKNTPVLMLTARDKVEDRVRGLQAGADDYLVKPFAFAELLARVNALSRRPPMADVEPVLKVGDLVLDRLQRTVARAGRRIELQPQEFKLLEYLMRHAGQVVTRTMLLENVWEFHFDPRTTVVETHISRLRGKVDRDFQGELIRTVRGAGYCIRAYQ